MKNSCTPSMMTVVRTVLSVLTFAIALRAGNTALADAEADLLIAYDQTYSSSVGGEDNAQVITANTVAGCNDINDRSGTGARLRICGYHQAAQYLYQTTSKGGFVNWMASYDSHMTDVVDAGNARGADLVAWLCVSTADGAAAVAQQPGRYSAFDPGQFWSAVVAHELGGHNYGCDHSGGKGDLPTAYPKSVMMHNYCNGGGASPPYLYSNPNIWLGGVRMQGVGSTCLGGAVNNGDNAYLKSTTCQGVADSYARVIVGPNLGNVVRQWSFNQAAASAPSGTTVTDSVSGTALATVQGNGANFTGSGLLIPGGASGSGAAYLQLPGGIISSYANATIEIWAKEISAQNWARVLDFNNGTANYITLSACQNTDLNSQRFESVVGGATVTLDSGIPTTAGVLHHYAITYASTGGSSGRWAWYRDGDQVAYLDVAYALSSLQDVNNWLGRSAFSSDAFANCEYQEVRISNVAMSRDEVLANYTLGPNHTAAAVMLTADDPLGSASFAAAGNWSDGLAPSAGKSYETYRFRLRTPADGASRTFAGQSLNVDGGGLTWKGTSSSTLTISALTLSGDCELLNAGSGTFTLAGNVAVKADEAMVRAANGPINLTANLSGSGNLLHVNNTVTLSGNNAAFTGKTIVGDGRFSAIQIDSEARLGANPTNFVADQLTLNRGILYNTGNVTIDDTNRGIRIGVSAGIFNVASGTTLTLAVPLSSPASGSALVTAPIYPNPVSGMLIKDNTGTLVLTHPNNSYIGEIIINAGGFTVSGAGRLNNGDDPMPIVNNGTLTFNTTGDQLLGGAISGSGALLKSNTSTLSLNGANIVSGPMTVSGGKLLVNGNSTGAGAVTVANGGTLGGTGSVGGSVTVQSGGTLSPGAGIGTFTVNANVTLQAGSTNFIEISKSPLSRDVLNVTGTLALGGTLRVTNLAGTLAYGDTFTIFQAGTVSGGFSAYALPSLAAGLKWDTNAILSGVISVGSTNDVPPLAPAGLAASWISTNQVRLVWNAAYGATAYNLKRSTTPGGPYTTIATGVTNTFFNNGNLAAGTTYYYVVSAVNPFGESANSPQATATAVVTKALWNFQEGTADTYVPYAPASAGQYDGSMHDVSGSGNNLSAWSGSWEWYRAQVPAATTPQTGAANTLSVQNANSYPAMSAIGTSLTSWNPTQWTIEAAIRPDSATSGYQTFVGRDSQGAYAGNTALAALYFSILPGGNLRIMFTDSAGNNWDLDSAAGAVSAAKWQSVVATSDGKTLALYLKNITDGAPSYTQLGTLDISSSANPALSTGAGNGTDWDPGVFTVTRGLYNGGHTDRFFGYIDDVRLTAGALNPAAFLYSSPPAFPAAPTGLAANAVTNNRINLTWSASGGATGYYVKRSTSNGGPYTIVAGPTGTSFNDTGVTNGTLYFYVVSALNSAGEGANSTQVSARAVSFFSPDIAFAGSGVGSQITLSWPGDHTGWRLQVQTNTLTAGLGTNWFDVPGSTTTNSVSVPMDLMNGSVFYRLIYP